LDEPKIIFNPLAEFGLCGYANAIAAKNTLVETMLLKTLRRAGVNETAIMPFE
jgi:hypothetical protein